MPEDDEPNPGGNPGQQGDPDGLGDAGRRAIAAERTARADAERQLRDVQMQLAAAQATQAQLEQQTQTLTSERDAAGRESLRYRVGLERGLPPALVGRLQGDDEAALTADADALLALIPAQPPSSTTPRPDPSQGSRTPAASTPEAAFAAFMGSLTN